MDARQPVEWLLSILYELSHVTYGMETVHSRAAWSSSVVSREHGVAYTVLARKKSYVHGLTY